MNVRLTRLSKTDKSGSLRGEAVEGYATGLPAIGERYTVWHEYDTPTGFHDVRIVSTSTVQVLHSIHEFSTRTGSRYRVDVLP